MLLSVKGFGLKKPLVQLLSGVGAVGQLWAVSRERAERGGRKERTESGEKERAKGLQTGYLVAILGQGSQPRKLYQSLRAEYGKKKRNNQLRYTKERLSPVSYREGVKPGPQLNLSIREPQANTPCTSNQGKDATKMDTWKQNNTSVPYELQRGVDSFQQLHLHIPELQTDFPCASCQEPTSAEVFFLAACRSCRCQNRHGCFGDRGGIDPYGVFVPGFCGTSSRDLEEAQKTAASSSASFPLADCQECC